MQYDYLIVGAGLAGCTIAERLATQLDRKVLLVESRNHIGGNTYDYHDSDGILVQKYGPHIFHTNSITAWGYLSQFTKWNKYVHRVLAYVQGKHVNMPISIVSLEQLYGKPFTENQFRDHLESRKVSLKHIENSRDVVISQIGEELYNLFFKNYTKKQWGIYPHELDAQVTSRLPVRYNRDTRYFTDVYQGLPSHGFTKMFENMLLSKNIHFVLNTDYHDIQNTIKFNELIFTGPIDRYFDYQFGKLPYRSLEFEYETLPIDKYQEAAVVNYPNDQEFTRITEFKQLYLQENTRTTICREYSRPEGDPYYPIPRQENTLLYERYQREAAKYKTIHFVGRLAEYKYLNMDQVVDRALGLFQRIAHG